MSKVFTDHNFWVWLDIETTGSDFENHSILEIAWVITNPKLEVLNEQSFLVKSDLVDLSRVNTFVGRMHTANGLWEEWVCEGNKKSLGYIRQQLADTLISLGASGDRVLLCGSGAGRFDRPFLEEKYPGFCSGFTYYDLDVSVLRRFFDWEQNFKGKSHRALDDCKQAIEEYKFYLSLKEKINVGL